MICLYEELPCSVVIDGVRYGIITDFREWIRLIALIKTEEVEVQEKAILMMEWYSERPDCKTSKALSALAAFLQGDEDVESKKGANAQKPKQVFCYEYDADVIYADFMRVYNIDLLAIDYMHWWKFKALLNGLPDDTEFKKRVYYRTVNLAEIEDDKERKHIARIKQQIALPASEISDEDIGSAFW